MSEHDIDLAEIPEITEEQLKRAVRRVGGKPVARRKVRISMFLDADIVAYFKAQAGGRGYQTLINRPCETASLLMTWRPPCAVSSVRSCRPIRRRTADSQGGRK